MSLFNAQFPHCQLHFYRLFGREQHCGFDDSLGHAGADAAILKAFKRGAHEPMNIGRTAPGTV